MVYNKLRVQNFIELHDRGDERKASQSGQTLYVNNGYLRTVDNTGNVNVPLEIGLDGTTTAPAPGFGTWTTADANRPAEIEVDATAQTDGTSRGEVVVDVDESGGTTADYSLTVAYIDPDNATGAQDKDALTAYIPAGAQYQVRNASDPNAANTINTVRQITK